LCKKKIRQIFNNVKKSGDTLSQKAVRSSFWVFLLRIIQLLFSLSRLIILANFLLPHDFGLIGIALLTMSILETFSQTGFQAALIQKKEDINSYLDSAWTILILRGLILFIILYFIAPYTALFFNAPEAEPIIQVIGFSFFIQAFTNIGIIYFQKDLEFNKEFVYQFIGTLTDFIVSILSVLILKNVWAFVFGLLAGNTARCIISYLIHPYRPKFNFNLNKIKELFNFGKWILGSSILIFLITQGDDIFVGKLLGATALGYYQLAYKISNIPATEITHVISQVSFPTYSKLQDDIPQLRETYLKVLLVTAFLSIPLAGFIFILAPEFIKIFLCEKWMPMVPAIQILAIWGAIRSIGATIGPVFQGIGKPSILTKSMLIQLSLMIILIYPLTYFWDIFGASLAVLIPGFIINIYVSYRIIILLKCKPKNFYKEIIFPFFITIILILSIFVIKIFLISINIIEFLLLVSIGSIIIISLTYLIDKIFNYEIKSSINNIIREFIK